MRKKYLNDIIYLNKKQEKTFYPEYFLRTLTFPPIFKSAYIFFQKVRQDNNINKKIILIHDTIQDFFFMIKKDFCVAIRYQKNYMYKQKKKHKTF